MTPDERLLDEVARHPYPLIFATISGAHLYGFPSPDSDYDLRGCHVLPAREVVGLDPVPELLELARARALPNTEFVEGDGTALPFPDGAFDLAGTHRTLHHVAQPERIVAELARVTRPGGRVLVVDQLASDDATVAATLHEFETARDSSHTRLLTDGELRELFAANELALLRQRHEEERRALARYVDLAGCAGDARARAEALAAGDPRVLVASVGWYLLAWS